MNGFWPDAAPIKKAKPGYVYMTVLFIAFVVFVLASFLLAVTAREGTFLKAKWTYFEEDLDFEDHFLKALTPEKRLALKEDFLAKAKGRSFTRSYQDQGLGLDFEIINWHENLGKIKAYKEDGEKWADFYLFDPIFEEERPYLTPNSLSESLQVDLAEFMENPSLHDGHFIQVGPGQNLSLLLGPKDLQLMAGDQVVFSQDKLTPLYLENLGTLTILGPGSFEGILVNKNTLLGQGCLLRGLYISDYEADLQVRGQVIGQARSQDAIYDKNLAYRYLAKTPFFFDFQIKNIQSRPHDYF